MQSNFKLMKFVSPDYSSAILRDSRGACFVVDPSSRKPRTASSFLNTFWVWLHTSWCVLCSHSSPHSPRILFWHEVEACWHLPLEEQGSLLCRSRLSLGHSYFTPYILWGCNELLRPMQGITPFDLQSHTKSYSNWHRCSYSKNELQLPHQTSACILLLCSPV